MIAFSGAAVDARESQCRLSLIHKSRALPAWPVPVLRNHSFGLGLKQPACCLCPGLRATPLGLINALRTASCQTPKEAEMRVAVRGDTQRGSVWPEVWSGSGVTATPCTAVPAGKEQRGSGQHGEVEPNPGQEACTQRAKSSLHDPESKPDCVCF